MDNQAKRDLPQLLDLLTNAVVTLDAAGVDSYENVSLSVTARRNGRNFGRLSIEGGHLALETGESGFFTPPYLYTDHEGNRRALLLAELCYIMWHWCWDAEDMADYLGCGTELLSRWIRQSQGENVPELPSAVSERVRRLIIVDQHRMILGVTDDQVADWLRDRRQGFGARSILDVLSKDEEPGFRRVELWLLNGSAPGGATLH